jgi:hypothetical protein
MRPKAPGVKRGRKPLPLPTGMARAVRTRGGVEFYADGWPEGIGPTWGVVKRNPSGRKPGRPKRPFREGLKLIVLRTRMKTYEAQGCSRESAVLSAMADLHWRNGDKPAEVKRVLLEMRRIDKTEQEASAKRTKGEAKRVIADTDLANARN